MNTDPLNAFVHRRRNPLTGEWVLVSPQRAMRPWRGLEEETSLQVLPSREQKDLADLVIRLTARYDALFQAPFPYSMGVHQKPTDGREHSWWHWHVHYFPPLLRSASVRKFMAGFELFAMPQRDLSAEISAEMLRSTSAWTQSKGAGQ